MVIVDAMVVVVVVVVVAVAVVVFVVVGAELGQLKYSVIIGVTQLLFKCQKI